MDNYLADFIHSNYNENNKHKNILLYLFLYYRNDSGYFNRRVAKYLENKSNIIDIDLSHRLNRYKSLYENITISNISPISEYDYISTCQVKNFRGFGQVNDEDNGVKFKLSKLNNIIFAPNGGGKTSFCELLEYVTTGTIKEADRRKTTLNKYIARPSGKPKKITVLSNKNEELIASQENLFNFIDRNRLQAFSLLGSKDSTIKERDIIAALVGLEDFDNRLTKLVQPSSFSLSSIKKNTVTELYQKKSNTHDVIKLNHKDNLYRIGKCEEEISSILGGCTNKYAKNRVDIRMKISRLERLLDLKQTSKKRIMSGALLPVLSVEEILSNTNKFIRVIEKTSLRKERLLNEVFDINYIDFYEQSKIFLSSYEKDICPLCQTSYEVSNENPEDFIEGELKKFRKASKLRTLIKNSDDSIDAYSIKFKSYFERLLNVDAISTIISQSEMEGFIYSFENKHGLLDKLSDIVKLINEKSFEIRQYNLYSENNNAKIKQSSSHIEKLDKDIKLISGVLKSVNDLYGTAKYAYQKQKTNAEKIIQHRIELKELEPSYKLEEDSNLELDLIEASYIEFRESAYKFKEDKESEILENLEDDVLYYYNKINHHDLDENTAIKVEFKKEVNYRIFITYQGGEVHDAFISLSEGHLRALGLSILLALAKKKNAKFIIFDDVVNAIDTEHRANIIELFLRDPFVSQTQQIITTHDRLFWERYSLKAASYGNGELQSYVLDSSLSGIFCIQKNVSFQDIIKDSLASYDIRQALIYSRVWYETMVSEFCTSKEVVISGSFSSRQLQKPNFIKVSLESMYAAFSNYVSFDPSNLEVIKNDAINWSSQNQEHHAFSEHSYNIVHAKTSAEVLTIFKALKRLEIQIYPNEKLETITSRLDKLNPLIERDELKINNADRRVPVHVVKQWRDKLNERVSEKNELESLKQYCSYCVDQIAERERQRDVG